MSKTKSKPEAPANHEAGGDCPSATCSPLSRYQADVMKSAKNSHMWLNAFSCIRPTEDFKMQIGAWVLAKLNDPDSQIQADYDDGPLADLKQPEVVLRFNKS